MIEINLKVYPSEERAELIVGDKVFNVVRECPGVHRLVRPDDVSKETMVDGKTLGAILANELFSKTVDVLRGLEDVESFLPAKNEDLWREDLDEYELEDFHGRVF